MILRGPRRPLAPCLALAVALAAMGQAQDGIPEHPGQIATPLLAPYAPPRPSEHALACGSRVLLLTDRELPLVDGRLRLRVGTAHEPAHQVGLATVLVEALRGGGAGGELGLSGPELDAWLDARGAQVSLELGLEELQISFSCLRPDLGRLLELLAALIRDPLYPQEELERAVLRLRTDIARRDDDAARTADRLLLQVVYGEDSPFARVPSPESVARIDRTSVLAFHRAHLGADRLWLGLCGDLTAEEALPLLEQTFGELPTVGPAPEVPAPAFRQPARTSVFVYDRPGVPQTQIRMIAPGVRRLDEDAAPLRLFTLAIGAGGFTNRMMLRVRTELGLAYDVGAAFQSDWERRGTFRAWGATRNEALAEAVGAMLGVLRGGLAPMTAEELESARARDAQHRLRDFRDPPAILERALDLVFHGYPAGFWETQARRLRELQAEEIAAAATRHLDPGRLVIVAVGPAQQVLSQLAAIGPIERLDGARPVPGDGQAQARLEQLLSAVGGQARWDELRFLEVHARVVARVADVDTRYETRVWHDLEGLRVRIASRVDGVDSTIVLTPKGARLRAGDTLLALPESQHRSLLLAADSDLFRILRRAAAGDLEAQAIGERGLRLGGGEGPLVELELDGSGLPRSARVLSGDLSTTYRYEAWARTDRGLRYPTRILREGPEPWTREITRLEIHPRLEDELFERP